MERTGCPKGRHSAWAPIAGFRSAIGEGEFAIASGGPPPPFLCESLVRCETPASDFRLLWMRKRAGAFRPQLLLVPSRRQLEVAGGLKGKALTKQEGHTGTHWQARRCVGVGVDHLLSRSDATEAEAAPCWLDRPLLLAMAHVPEHPLVAGGGLEVAPHAVALAGAQVLADAVGER